MHTQTKTLIQITILLRLLAKVPTTNAIKTVEPAEAACCWPYLATCSDARVRVVVELATTRS
ncbi:hypothetical protein HYFRA_00013352 [Hymenoscyphus fraxineus]|uniref:Secreted protein n=1 Tax=Hymenoscyphus fraxineus TaxID=746836 RepID=A0A9N9L978_9HELO|nr:hypothetical protein HYFRA_00013352 [Hymenoscyphus fraxineus]